MPKAFPVNDLTGGLNLTLSTNIPDNNLTIAKNVFYNKDKQLQTRYGVATFGDSIGTAPVTSGFYYRRDDTLQRILVVASGDSLYSYDGTSTFNVVANNLLAFETLPGRTTERTRRDFCGFRNSIYMCDGVNPYCAYDGVNYGQIDITTVSMGISFTNATNLVNKTAHGLSDGDELYFTVSGGSLPAEITPYQVYYIINSNTNDFQISTTKNGTAVTFTDDGTGTFSYHVLGQPRVRYIEYLNDRIVSAGHDGSPSVLYYTNTLPANGNSLSTNSLFVGADESSIINGLKALSGVVLAMKSNKIYSIDFSTPASTAIDAQGGGYGNRTIKSVENGLLYFNEQGIDRLKARNAVTGGTSINAEPLSDNIRRLTNLVATGQLNSGCSRYKDTLNNYYFSFDTNDDNIPDTTLVYSSLVGAWTQYTLPSLYDYFQYQDSDNVDYLLIGSATSGQVYEIETGFQDLGEDIQYEIETKRFDRKAPGLSKLFDFVDIVGYKSLGSEISVKIKIDGDVQQEAIITDAAANIDSVAKTLGTKPLGTEPLTGETSTTDIDLFQFTFRVPMYVRGSDIAVNISSTGGTWIIDKMRISKEDEPFEVFNYNSIG